MSLFAVDCVRDLQSHGGQQLDHKGGVEGIVLHQQDCAVQLVGLQ